MKWTGTFQQTLLSTYKQKFIMKNNYTLTVLLLFFTLFVKGQQATNTAGQAFSNGNNGLIFSMGEPVNKLFSTAGFTVKAGVIQCPVPAVFSFQQVINPCIPDGGGISLALSGSEANVRYELWLDGNPLVDSLFGTGNALNLLNASQAGIYTVRASYSGMACLSICPNSLS